MDAGDDSTLRSATQGRDLDEARLLYETAYPGDGFLLEHGEGPFSYRYSLAGDADVTLRTSEFRGRAHGVVEEAREYIVSWLHEGHGVTDVGRDETVQTLHVPHVAPTRAYEFDYADYRQNLVHLEAGYLERVADEHEGTDGGPLLFRHSAAPAPDALARWRAVLSETTPLLLSSATPLLLRAEADRRLAVAVLDTFAHESAAETATAIALVAGGARLRRAVEHLRDHAHEPVGLAEAAAVAGLSSRGLQAAFARHLGTTPTLYLRSVRLERARAELRELDPTRATVAEVARRWGFGHLGRFSGTYRQRFGEYPSETLQRGP